MPFIVKNVKIGFLFGFNVHVFITMVLFLWLKTFINFKKWVYKEMVESFLLKTIKGCPRALENILLKNILDA